MAATHRIRTLARFMARIPRGRRLVTIPREIQRDLGLRPRTDNHLVLVSVRRRGSRTWVRHYFKLTTQNGFLIPKDVAHLKVGDTLDVRVHRIVPDEALPPPRSAATSAAGLLLELMKEARPGWRTDGAARHDEYLNEEIRARH